LAQWTGQSFEQLDVSCSRCGTARFQAVLPVICMPTTMTKQKDAWILFIDRLIDRTAMLSAEMSEREQALIFRDGEGKVVLKESVAALPTQVWLEKK
jgi:hypothetical protein